MNILMMSVSKNFLFESVFYYILQEKFEDAKWVIRSRKSKKDRKHKGKVQQDKQRCTKHYTENTMAERKGTTGLTTMYKTLHRKLKIEQHEPHKKLGMTSVRFFLPKTMYVCLHWPFFCMRQSLPKSFDLS